MFVTAIVLAAGKGKRFGSPLPKPFVKLGGRRIMEYCLRSFKESRDVKQVVIAAGQGFLREAGLAARHAGIPDAVVVRGGRRRQDSVRNALRWVDSRAEIVLVHDSARPFVGAALTAAVIRQARISGAAIAAVPVKATIKTASVAAGGRKKITVKETLDRGCLWETQTPQAFSRELIVRAYRAGGAQSVTDDASLVEALGHPVAVVAGEYTNIKITTPEDLVIAKAIVGLLRSK